MENFDTHKLTPWLIGGALGVIALVWIVGSGSGGSSANNAGAAVAASDLASNNALAAQTYSTQTAAAVALGQAAYQSSGVMAGYLTGALTNMGNVTGQVQLGMAQTQAGLISSVTSNQAAAAMESIAQSNRTAQIGFSSASQQNGVADNAAAQTAIAQAAANASTMNGLYSLIGTTIKTGASLATTAALA